MRQSAPNAAPLLRVNRTLAPGLLVCAALLACGASGGCAALTNPVADGVPVRRLPPELLAQPQNGEQTLPLTLLGQPHPAEYRLAPGDILGVYVEGFLGDRSQPLPIHVGPRFQQGEEHRLASALGYPVAVQEDGTISLPPVGAVSVNGLTAPQAAAAIRKVYTDKQLLKPETDRILVSLLDPRQEQVLVLREESPNLIVGPEGVISGAKRGTGHQIDLPAYENDVLHALTRTGGLPGLDAFSEVVIYRGCFADDAGRTALQQEFETRPQGCDLAASGRCVQTIRIPLRVPPGVAPPFRPEDVILHTGDAVLLECRDAQVFYTAGLLPPGAHVLPRDYDLDVVAAIAEARGPLVNGGFAVSNLSGALIAPGLGGPSPSLLTVLRRTPRGGQVSIVVDLNRAMRDPRERIAVQAGDVLILQEQPGEAVTRYFTQSFFNFNLVWQAFHSPFGAGTISVSTPQTTPTTVQLP
jgi:hypothetical protein